MKLSPIDPWVICLGLQTILEGDGDFRRQSLTRGGKSLGNGPESFSLSAFCLSLSKWSLPKVPITTIPGHWDPEPNKQQYWNIRNHELRAFCPLSCSCHVSVSYTNLSDMLERIFHFGCDQATSLPIPPHKIPKDKPSFYYSKVHLVEPESLVDFFTEQWVRSSARAQVTPNRQPCNVDDGWPLALERDASSPRLSQTRYCSLSQSHVQIRAELQTTYCEVMSTVNTSSCGYLLKAGPAELWKMEAG